MTPDVLIVGHIAKDITDDGWRAGGSVLYAAAQCQKLGLNTAVVTAWAESLDPAALVPGVAWQVRHDENSTTFENRYVDGNRTQRLLARGVPLGIEDIPEEWQMAPIVLLMPVFHDVEENVVSSFSCSATLLGVTLQGWLRQLDITVVRPPTQIPAGREWQGADFLFLSEEDIADPEAAEAWAQYVPHVILTRGKRGATVWSSDRRIDLPAVKAPEVDPTGAGDIYATSFAVRYRETGDVAEAAGFAAAAAAISVGGVGLANVANRATIEALRSTEAAKD